MLAVAREDSFPQRRVPHYCVCFIKAAGSLERRAVDLAEDNPPVDVGDAIVISAEHAIGVRDAESRLSADVALSAQNVIDRPVTSCWRQTAVIRCRENSDTGAGDFTSELERAVRLRDAPGVNEIVRSIERVQSLEEEWSFLREEQRLPGIDHELSRIGFDFSEIGIHRAVECESVGDSPLYSSSQLRRAAVVLPSTRTRPAADFVCQRWIHIEHQSATEPSQSVE